MTMNRPNPIRTGTSSYTLRANGKRRWRRAAHNRGSSFRASVRTVIFAQLVLAPVGCASLSRPPAPFLPTEAITAENAPRLAHLVSWRLADHSLAELLVDPARAIGPIAVDADRQAVLVNRHIGTGSRMRRPVGIEEYALTDGRLLRTTRIPAYPDLTGSGRASSRDVMFDLSRRQAYLTCGWETRRDSHGPFHENDTPAGPVDLRPGVV